MEEFRKYDENFEVSNLGNVKKNGVQVKPTLGEYYYYVYIDNKPVRVHVMVGKCFPEICGKYQEGYHYHHINHNQLDNRAENIVCISSSDHKRIHQHEDGCVIPVTAYNKNGEKVGSWESLVEAQMDTNAYYGHIGKVCMGERATAGGLFWVFNDDTEAEAKVQAWKLKCLEKHRRANEHNECGLLVNLRKALTEYRRKQKRKLKNIVYLDKRTNKVTVYKNLCILCNGLGLRYGTVYNALTKHRMYDEPTFRIIA